MFNSPSSEFVYIRTYSKWIEELGRRETWEETVGRYVNFLKEERGELIPQKVLRKIESKILNLEVMPSMRALWTAGKAAKADNTCMYNCSFTVVDRMEAFAEGLYILMCGSGLGFSVESRYIKKLPTVPTIDMYKRSKLIIEDSKKGWADSVKALMETLYKGEDLELDYTELRPKGARLITMGGRSSGPAPLVTLHSFIRDVFFKAQSRQLTSLECHDIMNQIAESVVVGGVRRSSQVSLSDLTDEELRHAKDYPFPPRRSMANNSAVYEYKPSAIEFLKEWYALAASGTGERGIFNLGAALTKTYSRRDVSLIAGTNPCVTGDTEILTDKGYKQIETLVEQEIIIWNGTEWSKVTPKLTGINQPIVTVSFSDGRALNCTKYHTFHIAQGYTGKSIEVKAINLEIGMKLIKHEFPVIEHGLSLKNAYTQGFVSAEGMDNYDFVWVYEPKFICLNRLKENTGTLHKEWKGRIKLSFKDPLLPKAFIPFDYDLKSKVEWLSGLFDGDGTELKEGGLQIVSTDFSFLTRLQKLLSTVGVQAKIVQASMAGLRSMPDGHGGARDFYCQQTFRVCIGAVQMQQLKANGLRCERMAFNKQPQRDASQFVTITSITEAGIAPHVYCFNEPKKHRGIFNGILTGQCAEILLRDKGFCNLSEVVIREHDDIDSLLDKVETATWIGAIQSTFTDFPYLSKEWKLNAVDERLLGVSLTGQLDNPKLLTEETLRALKNKAIKVAQHASSKLKINMPAAITCVKPSGTVSQLVDSSSGLHPRFSKYYIRRYRISATDPLFKMLKSQGIEMCPENGQTGRKEEEVDTWIISFPVKAPEHSVVKDEMSAIEQLEWYKKVQTNWCEHNASVTVYVRDTEWIEVGDWVYKNWESINGVSFLPYDGGRYEQAPYETITVERYNKLVAELPKIDYTKLSGFELEDSTEGAKTYSCTGDKCEIV